MKLMVDFEECLKDSPRFRAAIEEAEGDFTELESKLEKVVKLCIGMIDAGKNFCNANKQFVNGIRELAQHSTKDEVIENSLMRFSESLLDMVNFHMILFDQVQRSIKLQLQTFVKEDLRKFKEAKKQFDKINVLQSKRRSEIIKSMLSFMYAHLTFFHQGYDLFMELEPYMKDLGSQLDKLVVDAAKEKRAMEHKHSTIQQKDFSSDDPKIEFNADAANGIVMEGYLYKRASNAFKTWNRKKTPHIRRWFSIQNNQLVYQKKFKDNLTVVVDDLRLCTVKPCEDIERRFCFEVVSPTKSCMLQADSEKIRQVWIKAVQASIASAYKEKGEESYADKLDRKSSPSTSSLDSGSELKERPVKGESALQRVECIAGNTNCCDCGQADPRWASINLGITLCIECSGIHRSLGVHFSKVRSLTLDSWEPELLKLMCALGNDVINGIYEAQVDGTHFKKPNPGDPRLEKENWIKAKYVEKRFIQKAHGFSSLKHHQKNVLQPTSQLEDILEKSSKLLSVPGTSSKTSGVKSSDSGVPNSSDENKDDVMSLTSNNNLSDKVLEPSTLEEYRNLPGLQEVKMIPPGLQLYNAAHVRSLPDMAEALACGADVNWVNPEDNEATPLIQAVLGGSLVACEFLLQNGADVNRKDCRGRGPLHHATILGHTGQVCLFLKRGADQDALDEDQKDPLTIAVEAANADIVTLLRLAKMNDEMRESEGLGQSGDATYQDIFRDFSHMASHNPEILNRFHRRSQND
ncbi:arf-GAP with coiled-coil, ANK repeat and PH domain-containing protein 2-like isoform X3 [Hypanus sabinus]|uniref:arf-GAP with coiled-coil, ANK repeat and PH domain-containing protein 2-like isoform X3 n=1 Tax=Hypanus sabinus TaxID=79690 RepID=UPI0028C42D99|nr:arf-GAP with coiled-coil, ANK repeat and PH domain-containing protein 2-like isoform X3 [Hypanus sabinus]